MWDMHDGSGWWMLFGCIWFIIFWAVIISFGIWIIRKLTERDSYEVSESALSIAKQRYARGEISRGEFEQIKKDLS